MFDAELREAARRGARLAPDAPVPERRNATVAVLRLLSWLETIADRTPGFAFEAGLPGRDEDVGRKQVRALELIIRSLVTEQYEDQASLVARLKDLLSEKVVQQWLAAADKGDVLSGTTFSELSSLFVSTQEYPNYDPLYRDTPLLSLLKEKRVTIRNYLDDIRRIRNVLAHNKRVTPAQIALLDMYYEELVEPLQEAHDQGRTKVNPDLYLDVSAEELEGYFSSLSGDLKSVKDDIGELKAELGGKLDALSQKADAISATAKRTEAGTRAANRKLWLTLGVLALVAVAVGGVLFLALGTKETTERIAGDAQATRETAGAIRGDTAEIKGDTAEIRASQARAEAAIGQIAAGFERIDRQGGVIANPQRPEEHYHNAIVQEQRGEPLEARKSYLAFAGFDLDAIDVYERFARLLRVQDGRAGAREVFADLARRLKAPAIALVYAMQFEDAERTARMEAFMQAHADYGPAFYLLAQEYSPERTGGQSVSDKRREFELLTRFLDADGKGALIPHFVDQQVLGAWLDAARARVKTLEPQLDAARTEPTMTQSRFNGGWTVFVTLPEPALSMSYRIGGTGDFVDAGQSNNLDPRTGKPMPNTLITLGVDQEPTTIHVKYVNAKGQEMGPFALAFVTTSALVEEQKRILEMTWTSWLAIQRYDADMLIYYTHLVSYRCGVAKVVYGVNKETPDTELTLPPCDEREPYAIPGDVTPYFKGPPDIGFVTVQLTYQDGAQSAVRRFTPQ